MYDLTEKREEELQVIADQLNDIGQWYQEYNTENEDNPYADYASWGWSEGEGLYLEGLGETTGELVEKLKELCPNDNDFDKYLVECSDLTYTPSYWAVDDEIFSVLIGEFEIQISGTDDGDAVLTLIEKLTDDEFDWLERHSDYYPSKKDSDFMYGQDGGRWGLILDADQLADKIKELQKNYQKKK